MKKIDEKYNNFTLAQLESMLRAKVDDYNLATDAKSRNDLEFEYKRIIDAYNVTSLLTVFRDALKCKDKSPVQYIAETGGYDTINVKTKDQTIMYDDGTKGSVKMKAVEYGGAIMNLFEFIEWAEGMNRSVTANKRWRTAYANAYKKCVALIEDDINSKDGKAMSNNKVKSALNEMFDALVFIPTEKGENALMANGPAAQVIKHFSNTAKVKFDNGKLNPDYKVLPENKWKESIMTIMHTLLTGQEFTFVSPEIKNEDEAEAETK